MRKRKAFISIFGIVFLSLIIHSYMGEKDEEKAFPKMLYGIPTYDNSRINYEMSSLNSDPYIAVFMTGDSFEKVLQFYKDRLNKPVKVLEYGRGSHKTKTIYQFQLLPGVLPNYPAKGVEIHPLNSRSQRVYRAKTKIKIILPRKEVHDSKTKRGEKGLN